MLHLIFKRRIMKYKILVWFAFIFISQNNYAQFTDEINSIRPGESMMAFSVGKTIFQAEAGLAYVSEKHSLLGYEAKGYMADLALRYGFFKEELEIIAEVNYQIDKYSIPSLDYSENGFRQLTLGSKYLIYDPFKNYEEKPNLYSWKANHRFKWRQFIPAVAAYAGAQFSVGDNPFNYYGGEEPTVSPKIMAIAQNHFGNRWVLVTNIMYDRITAENKSINYILTLTYGFNEKWSGFVENQGYNGKYYSDGIFRIGATYLFNKNMQIDISGGKNIKNTPEIFNINAGFSWRFTENYQEIKLEKNKGSKLDQKMKKKAEKEQRKRKDVVE